MNSFEIDSPLDGTALKFLSKKFTVAGSISETEKDFTKVDMVFLEWFSKGKEPKDVIREAIDTTLDKKNIVSSLRRPENVHRRAGL